MLILLAKLLFMLSKTYINAVEMNIPSYFDLKIWHSLLLSSKENDLQLAPLKLQNRAHSDSLFIIFFVTGFFGSGGFETLWSANEQKFLMVMRTK